MRKKKENDEILAGIKRIRRSQILTSFDVVFMILVPIAVLVAGYIMTHPEVLIRFDPPFLYNLIVVTLALPLSMGIIGILMESIQYRLIGWWLFFIFGIFSYLSYSLFSLHQGVTEITLGWQLKVYSFFGFGSLLIGFGAGDLFFEKIFLNHLFLARTREVGITRTKIKEKLQKFPDKFLYALLIIGLILVLVGFLVIPLP